MDKPLLILKTGTPDQRTKERVGDYDDWFVRALRRAPRWAAMRTARRPIRVHDLTQGVRPCLEPAMVIVTGAPESVYDPLPWIETASAYIRDLIEEEIPLLGVCFGHQLVARAMGGRVAPNPRGWEIGTTILQLTPAGRRDPLLGRLPVPCVVQVSHRDSVVDIPDGWVSLASTAIEPHHAFRVGPASWTLQFHPEVDEPEVRALLASKAEVLHREGEADGLAPGAFVERAARGIRASEVGALLLGRFVELAEAYWTERETRGRSS